MGGTIHSGGTRLLGKMAQSLLKSGRRNNLPLKPIPQASLNLLQKLLDLEPRSRPKAKDCMTDPWLTESNLSSRKMLRTDIQVQMCMPDIREQ